MLEVLVSAPVIAGEFYVLYDVPEILVITQLADGGGAATWKPAWRVDWYEPSGYWADAIWPSATETAKVNVSAMKGNTSYLVHSADGASSWAITDTSSDWNRHYRGRSDLSTPGLMWVPLITFWGGAYNNVKVRKSTDGGANWSSATLGSISTSWHSTSQPVLCPMRNGSGYYVVHPVFNPSTSQYAQQWYKVDGGTSGWWESVSSTGYVYPEMAVDPTNTDRIFRVDGNQSITRMLWSTKSKTDITPPGTIVDITGIVCTSTGVVFAAVRVLSGGTKARIYWSSNQGSSWNYHDVTAQSDSVGDEAMILGITSDDVVAMMMNSGKVVFTSDEGATWGVTAKLGYSWWDIYASVLDMQGS